MGLGEGNRKGRWWPAACRAGRLRGCVAWEGRLQREGKSGEELRHDTWATQQAGGGLGGL